MFFFIVIFGANAVLHGDATHALDGEELLTLKSESTAGGGAIEDAQIR